MIAAYSIMAGDSLRVPFSGLVVSGTVMYSQSRSDNSVNVTDFGIELW